MILELVFVVFLARAQVLLAPMSPWYDAWSYCTGPRPRNCSETMSPVCAAPYTGLPQTYDNECFACNNFSVVAYIKSSCNMISTRGCRADNCGYEPERLPVCAFQEKAGYEQVAHTVCCEVQPTPSYKVLTSGNCPKPEKIAMPDIPGATWCKRGDRNRTCSQNIQEVCGYKGYDTDFVTKTFSSECQACNQQDIPGYTEGACSNQESDFGPKPYTYCSKMNTEPFFGILLNSIPSCPEEPACAIPYLGIPQDVIDGCKACQTGYYRAFLKGTCAGQVRNCMNKRMDCRPISARVRSCAFSRFTSPYNVSIHLCCQGTRFDQVLPQPCPDCNHRD